MPNLKKLSKFVSKAHDLHNHHRERHRPSGFAFALADSIDYLDREHWAKVTTHNSLFLSPRYLRILENAGPENLRPCYALVFHEKEPVAAIAAQRVTVSLSRLRKKGSKNSKLDRLDEKMLVCGNLLSWGITVFPSRQTLIRNHFGRALLKQSIACAASTNFLAIRTL